MSHPVGFDSNRDPKKEIDLDSSRKRCRSTRWTKEESAALYEVMENLSAEERAMKKKTMWGMVSDRMGNRGMTKSSKECKVKHKNTLQQYKNRHPSASSVIPYTQLKEFLQQEFTSSGPSPSESPISVFFEGCAKSIDINACSVVVAAATIRLIFDFEDAQRFWLVNESGIVYGIDRNMPPGNYRLHLAKSERVISVTFEGCTKSININACSEVIAAAIRSVFGLEDAERFWLQNESGVVYGIDRNMLTGNYSLHLVKDPKRNQQTTDFTSRSEPQLMEDFTTQRST